MSLLLMESIAAWMIAGSDSPSKIKALGSDERSPSRVGRVYESLLPAEHVHPQAVRDGVKSYGTCIVRCVPAA